MLRSHLLVFARQCPKRFKNMNSVNPHNLMSKVLTQMGKLRHRKLGDS